MVTGKVEKIAKIEPSSVFMDGRPGQTLEALVTVTPSQKYPFKILGMQQKINTRIRAFLVKPGNGEKSWQIRIKAMSVKPDDLYDVLTLKTDSPYAHELTIRVYASFIKKQDKKS